jgi:hypothetical protein
MIIQNELFLPVAAELLRRLQHAAGRLAPADLPLMKMLEQSGHGFGKELLSCSEVVSGLRGLAVVMTAAESVRRGVESVGAVEGLGRGARSRISVEDVS